MMEAVLPGWSGLSVYFAETADCPWRRDFIETYRLNVSAPAIAVKAKEAAEKVGRVVLFSSVAASSGFTSRTAIAAAKAGVEGLGPRWQRASTRYPR